jgi:hypothetical protein
MVKEKEEYAERSVLTQTGLKLSPLRKLVEVAVSYWFDLLLVWDRNKGMNRKIIFYDPQYQRVI